jgi:hypothetical protein
MKFDKIGSPVPARNYMNPVRASFINIIIIITANRFYPVSVVLQ